MCGLSALAEEPGNTVKEPLMESSSGLDEARIVKEWGGTDVIIKSKLDENSKKWLGDKRYVISLQNTEPRRRAVVTEYSKELSWLFYQLRDLFSGKIDYISKYDFYGLLAQSAIDYLANNGDQQDAKGLLIEVLNTAKGFCENESSN